MNFNSHQLRVLAVKNPLLHNVDERSSERANDEEDDARGGRQYGVTGREGRGVIRVTESVGIADDELSWSYARSGGPGGQNVNKLETRVTVRFDLARSPSLTEEQRTRIAERLATRVTKDGIFQVTSQRHRSQAASRAR